MTKNQFFKELAKIKGWENLNGNIRLKLTSDKMAKAGWNTLASEYPFCPICALSKVKLGREYLNGGFTEAARELDITLELANEIACSADGEKNAPYRKELLELCR